MSCAEWRHGGWPTNHPAKPSRPARSFTKLPCGVYGESGRLDRCAEYFVSLPVQQVLELEQLLDGAAAVNLQTFRDLVNAVDTTIGEQLRLLLWQRGAKSKSNQGIL